MVDRTGKDTRTKAESGDLPGIDRNVRPEDLASAFVILLGRLPDQPDLQRDYWQERSVRELVTTMATSAEFSLIHEALAGQGTLVARDPVPEAAQRQAVSWLSNFSPAHRPPPRGGWCDLLLGAATAPGLIAIGGPELSAEALQALRRMVEARRTSQEAGQDLVAFDANAFLAIPANRRYRDADGQVDFDTRIGPAAAAPVMLPLFTEGLSGVRGPGPTTLGAWLQETQDAALAGSLTHWLWDEATYRRNRAIADHGRVAEDQGGLAYLDFLATGDTAGISPHPLFCHQAFRILNGLDPIGDEGAFRRFVEGRRGDGLRTSALFDPELYLAYQPEARSQIASGRFTSALEHLVKVGLSAGHTFSPDFDRAFYLGHHPDVAQEIAEGTIPSAEWHYVFRGAREGRAPNAFFDPRYYVERYPFVLDEMAVLGIASSLEHFILLGQKRGWSANPPLVERPVAQNDARALFEKRGRRAFGEIIDGGIDIRAAEAPRLSVIVPVCNQADFTAGLLKSAAFAIETLRSRCDVETEIIVIDSGSRDHTSELLAALPAVRVERTTAPFSFPIAVNTGAAMARGDILLVVNNDIEFAPDAFDRVFAVLDDDPSVGVVGAKIILPNETLQELGASIDRVGNTEGLGRSTDAFRVKNGRRVPVDYASGCFTAFRRSEFEALSGFDEAFSPGYYEDVDFSLRMRRDLGKATVIDTGLAVTHYENASFAKGRPATVNMAGALRNRMRLKTAHAALFRSMEASGAAARATRARHALLGGARILFVEDMIPSARLGSGFGRQEAILDALATMGVAFDIAARNPSPVIDGWKDPRVTVFRGWMPGQSLDDVLHRHAADYSHLWICGGETLTSHAAVVAWAKASFDIRVICDVEVLGSLEAIERKRLTTGAVTDEAMLSAVANELSYPADVDQWVAVDERDRVLIEKVGLGPVATIGHASRHLPEVESERTFKERHRILFIGTVQDPNSAARDGVEWFLEDVWRRLIGVDDAKLSIVGAWCDDVVEALLSRFADHVELIGEVDDERLAEIYSETRVAIAPDRFSAGRSAKVAQATQAGVPTVMTDHVAERLGLADNPAIAQGRRDDGGRAFAEWLSRLYTDEAAWQAQLDIQRSKIALESAQCVAGRVIAALGGASVLSNVDASYVSAMLGHSAEPKNQAPLASSET